MPGCFSNFWNWIFGRSGSSVRRLSAGAGDEAIGANGYSYEPHRYGFPEGHGTTPNEKIAFNETFPANTIVCYTDGAVHKDDPKGPDTAACAGFFGENHHLNFAHRLEDEEKKKLYKLLDFENRPTFCEIVAVKTALKKLLEFPGSIEKDIIVRTDSLNMVRALRKKKVVKPELHEGIRELLEVISEFPRGMVVQHVYGHNGDPGNEMVDAMVCCARDGGDWKMTKVVRQKKYCQRGYDLSRAETTDVNDQYREEKEKQGISRITVVKPKYELQVSSNKP